MELAKVGFSMDFKKNPSFFCRPNFEWTYLGAQGEWRKNWGIVSREKVVCCRFMMFLKCFEYFKAHARRVGEDSPREKYVTKKGNATSNMVREVPGTRRQFSL